MPSNHLQLQVAINVASAVNNVDLERRRW